MCNTIAQDRIEEALRTNEETQYERYNASVDSWFNVRVFPDTNGLSIFFNDITERKEREIELERYEQIIETLPVAVGQNAPGSEGTFEYVNQGMVEMFGLESKETATEYSPADLYADPQERAVFNEKIQTEGEVHDFELQLEKPSGERFWGSATASLETIDGEEYFIGVIQDITERREYKHKLRDLHDATREMISASTPEDIADIVTRTADQSIGYEMNGVHFYDTSVAGLVPASVSETSQELIGDAPVLDDGIAWRAFQTGEIQVCNNLKEADNVFNEGTVLRSELAIPLGDHGVLLASDTDIGAFRDDDLTLIKILAKNAETALNQLQTEEELRDRERELERNQKLLDQTARAAKVGGWELDLETKSGNWTDQIYQIYDKPLAESPSLTESIEAFHPEDRATMRDAWQRLTAEGEPYDLKLRLETADATVKWVRVIGMPVYDDTGTEITAVRGIIQDITERKEREQELARQQNFLKQTQEVAHVGGWEVDMQTESLQWTDEVYRIHGEPLDYQPTVEDAISFYHPDDRDTLRDAFERVTANGEPFDLELRIVRSTGEVRWVRTRGEPWYQDDEIAGVRGTFQDITERKEREQELSRQQELLNTLFEYSPIHLFVKDRRCRHLWMSSALVDNPDQYIGKHELEVQANAQEEFCIEALREDRRVIDGEQRITDKEEYNAKLDTWLLTSKVPWYDKDGNIAGLLGYSVDITDRKRYQEKLEQQNERLDEFAGLISHDLRNPLTVALGRTTYLQQICDGESAEQLDVVAKSLNRMEEIIDDTLTLAQKGETVGDTAPVSLLELCGSCWQGVDTAEATLDFKDELSVKGDDNRLKHAFENLFRNAIEHGSDSVTVRIGRLSETGFYVEDDGPGVPEDIRDDVFEAGHTSERDGTGLGLAIVKRIAEAHGWEVSVTEGSDGGARFEFENVEFADT
jgi:PAS domain S-box-containing protein